jgi:hypothetical protein
MARRNDLDQCPRCKKRNKYANAPECSVCSGRLRKNELGRGLKNRRACSQPPTDIEFRIARLAIRAAAQLPLFGD